MDMQGESQDFQILALTGGGYRGLYSARVLEAFEEAAGRPIARCFDLVAGTSIGGILALAIAFEVPMTKVVASFKQYGAQVFPKKSFWAGLISSKYDPDPLKQLIASILPDGATLADAQHSVVIPALNLTLGKIQVLKTRHKAAWTRDHKYSVVDVALATSAAPVFFPIAELDQQHYSDGGLFANAPDLVALHEANKFFGIEDADIRMLSVGTLTSPYALPVTTKRRKGVESWMRPPTFPLVQTVLSAQQQLALQIVAHRLGDRHIRIDAEPSESVMATVGLDKADDASQRTLQGLGMQAATEALARAEVARLFNHTPKKWLFKEEGHG